MSLQLSQRRRGFTLMELLIVVAVVVLLVVATLPRVKYALDESKVRESSRQLNSYFALAKSRAASTGRPCGLWLARDLDANPTVLQSTQMFLAEIPPPYTGDVLDARAYVTGSSPWLINFPSGPGSLVVLISPGEFFQIRFDHKGPTFSGRRGDPSLPSPLNDPNYFFIVGGPTVPPTATGMAGYSFEIIRLPRRIGAPLALPRGTSIDLPYSGFGNSGQEFQVTTSHVLVMFSPDGHVFNVSIGTTVGGNPTVITDDAPGTIHFLVGRPEKVLSAPFAPESNIADNGALWVSVGRLTGSVVTTENAPNIDFVFTIPPPSPAVQAQERQAYLNIAREFAITQDVAGAR